MRREFLQLADTYKAGKHRIAGHWISEKLDGTRCFWDGGVTRGMQTQAVPYASVIDPKTGRGKAKVKPIATGLWSRYGNPIMAPDKFLDSLPPCPLDGELWAGRGKFQLCRSICGGDSPDPRFDQIQFAVYSAPPLDRVFMDGEIKNANMVANFSGVQQWHHENCPSKLLRKFMAAVGTFENETQFLQMVLEGRGPNVFAHKQVKLPGDELAAQRAAESFLNGVLDQGGEGAVLRDGSSLWTPKRHPGLLKYKPYEDAEATIIGYVTGREGKQGNVLGKIGALVCSTKGPKGDVEFELGTGLKMPEREFAHEADYEWACDHPETLNNDLVPKASYLRIGQTVTFKFREWTDDGIPKEGRYWRVREGVE